MNTPKTEIFMYKFTNMCKRSIWGKSQNPDEKKLKKI